MPALHHFGILTVHATNTNNTTLNSKIRLFHSIYALAKHLLFAPPKWRTLLSCRWRRRKMPVCVGERIDRGDREGSTGEPEGDDNDVIRLAAVQKHAPPSRSYADALRHRSLQSAGNRRRSHTQRASHRNPRPASSNQKRGADAITGTGSFGVLKSTGRGLESVNKRKRRLLHDWRETPNRGT